MRIALLLLVFFSAFATQETQKTVPLKLTLKVSESRYCVGDDELDGLQLKLRFVYENHTTGPVILYKSLAMPSRVMIARSLADAAAQEYELDYTLTWYFGRADGEEEGRCYKDAAPGDCFAIIAPGSSYEADGDIRVLAVRGDVKDIPGAVKSGEHALQLLVPTWHESGKLAQEIASRWRTHGTLWYQPVISQPLAFTIDKDRKVVECN